MDPKPETIESMETKMFYKYPNLKRLTHLSHIDFKPIEQLNQASRVGDALQVQALLAQDIPVWDGDALILAHLYGHEEVKQLLMSAFTTQYSTKDMYTIVLNKLL